MSGGVDSSTTAALLHEQGYDVVGITLQLYDHGAAVGRKGACCAGQDIHDARRVAEMVGFPHYVLDYESRFRQSVIDDFADSYLAGETPIPCVRCNQTVKFTDLLATARDLDADVLATGHYVRWRRGPGGAAQLWRGVDDSRDQSYFLFATTPEQLDFLRFPLGDMTKDRVRAEAERLGLLVADKPDSQDICFVPNGNYAGLVSRLRPGALDAGDIVHVETNEVLGRHDGIIRFTVGQRRGIGVAWDEPLYVVRIDAATNRVYVGPEAALYRDRLIMREVNWLGDEGAEGRIPRSGVKVMVKIRSMFKPVPATVHGLDGDTAQVVFDHPQKAVAPGQACVMYDGDRVLGGGWITRDEAQAAA